MGGNAVYNIDRRSKNDGEFEKCMREYFENAGKKLANELTGTREAIKILAKDKVRDFMVGTDIGLSKEEKEYLLNLIISSMYQSFCYGYGIGKIECKAGKKA